jgi:hypothetical protein
LKHQWKQPKECYQAIIEKDTITLTVDNNVNQFEGELDYSYYQRQSFWNTFLGNVKGDTILRIIPFSPKENVSKSWFF